MRHNYIETSRKIGKAQALKDGWIKEQQDHQRMMRDGGEPDSYESLADQYVKNLCKRTKPKKKHDQQF